jgi:hypothetical protein
MFIKRIKNESAEIKERNNKHIGGNGLDGMFFPDFFALRKNSITLNKGENHSDKG